MKKLFHIFLALVAIASLLAGTATPARAASLPAEINKQFTPLQIDAGGVSVLRISIFNPNTFPLTDVAFIDDLVGVQPGLYVANPAGVVNTCGGTVTAVPNSTTISLSGGGVPAQVGPTPGQCYIEVNVSSVTPGNLINTIPAHNPPGAIGLTAQGIDGGVPVEITNTSPASATITVLAVSPPSLSKTFSPNTIFVGQTSELTIRLNNNDVDTNLTGVSYTDNLPSGVVIATPNGLSVSGCGGGAVVTAPAGGTSISLTNGTVTPSVDCLISVDVTGALGQYTNTIPAGPGGPGSLQTNQGVTNNSPASAPLNIQPVGVTKAFSPTTVVAGNTSTLTITLQNPTGSPYTGVSITDSLPSGITVAGAPSTTCGAGVVSGGVGDSSVTLTGGTIPASATPPTPVGACTITVPVQADLSASGSRTNTIPENALLADQPGVTNYSPATANITINPALTGTKAYSPTIIPRNGESTVTITLTNNSATPLTNLSFTDTLPANLNISGIPASPQCGGTVTFDTLSDPRTVTLAGGSLAAAPGPGNTCAITFQVTTAVPGSGTTYENSIPAGSITTDEGVGNNSAITTGVDLTVVDADTLPVGVSKSFSPTTVTPGQASRVRITITPPADIGINGISITDTLPAGLVVATPNPPTIPNPSETCPGGTITAVPGTNTITFTNLNTDPLLISPSTCRIDVYVVVSEPGTFENLIPAGDLTTAQGRTNEFDSNTATLRVTTMTMSKAFYPTTVQANGLSTMTITLQNTSPSALINVDLLDDLPGSDTNGIRVAPIPNASTTCGVGVISFPDAPPHELIQLTGGTIPAASGGIPGICTITLDVQGRDSTPDSPSTRTNTIEFEDVTAIVQSTGVQISPSADASADLNIRNLAIGVVKGFDPVLVYGGATSTMTVQLINPGTVELVGIAFTDNMDLLLPGIVLANPVNFNTGTCGGTLTGNPGDASFSFSGGTLLPNSSCSLTLQVVMEVNGNRTNRIPAGAVTTFNGVSSTQPTEASLTNLPGVGINKFFNPSSIQVNETSTLTIVISNTSNIPVVNMGVIDNLPGVLPVGLEVANPANATNTCGGTVTAVPGSQSITLTGGGLAGLGDPGSTCQITVNVTTSQPGAYINTIPAGAITADDGVTNNDPTTDTLIVGDLFSLGNRVWFDTNNNSQIDAGEVGVDGVTVQLYAADGSGNPTGSVLATQVTTQGGYYRFDNLAPGDYVVVIPASQFDTGGPLAGYWSSGTSIDASGVISETPPPDPNNDLDNDDNGGRVSGGPFDGAVISGAVTLGPGPDEPTDDADMPPMNPAGEAPNDRSNRTVDFGFYNQQLGNLVFVDVNGNGTYNAGTDTPLEGAVVRLYSSDGTEINVGPDGILGTTDDAPGGVTTGPDGLYLFSGLPQGNYIVQVTPPPGLLSTVDTANPGDTANPNDNIDNNDNGVGTGSGTVSSNVVTLTPGNTGAANNNTVTDSTGTTTNPTVDFGFTPLYSLGNRVWFDTDNSSTINGSEVGVNGVTVQLYAASDLTTLLQAQTTANGGYYRFDDLAPGDYVVVIPASQFASGGPLAGYWSSGTTISGTGVISETAAPDPDNDVDNDDNGTLQTGGAFPGAVTSSAVTLGPGTNEPTNDTDADPTNPPGEAPNNQSNRTVDFGFYRMELGDLVFIDANENGTYDSGTDLPLAGATVQLFASDGVTEINVGPDGILGTADDAPGGVTTGANGLYLFSGLPQGNYIVRVTPPSSDYVSTVDTADNTDTTNPNTNTDNNDNGVGTASGTVSSNVVTLTPGSTGAANNNTVTNANGTTFDPTLDFGFYVPLYSLGNRVWFDTNNNSQIDAGEVGVNGILVELYAAGDLTTVIRTDTTANGGYYLFDNLPAGEYVVVVATSNFDPGGTLEGYWSSATSIDNSGVISETAAPDPDDNTDSDDNGTLQTAGPLAGGVASLPITLGPGNSEPTNESDLEPGVGQGTPPDSRANMTVDFGFYRMELGNLVFIDVNGNGTFDTGDLPLAGATVQLFASDGVTEINVGPDGILGTADDAPGGVTTGANGLYLFSGLPQGNYIVRVTPPVGYSSTVDSADAADTTDPNTNTDNNDNGVGEAIGQVTGNVVTLTAGSSGAQNNNTVNNASGTTTNPTVDFGFRSNSGLNKTILGTSEAHTSGSQVTIGEIVTYQVSVELPLGIPLINVSLTDRMDKGLAFVDCLSVVVAGTDVTGTVCPPPPPNPPAQPVVSAITDPGDDPANPANPGRQVVFTIGDLPAQTSPETIVIQYRAIVLDVLENQNGVQINNDVTFEANGSAFSTSAPNVEIIEPFLDIDKTATPTENVPLGTPVQFTLEIYHTSPQSQTDAFDVIVTDILPPTLRYVECTVQYSGWAPNTPASDYCNPGATTTDLIFFWDVFPLGESVTITFSAVLLGSPATNTASVEWTSLEIDPGLDGLPIRLSVYNDTSHERWYDPPNGVDIYSVSDSVTINPPPSAPAGGGEGRRLPSLLPATGFAPDTVTALLEQPREKMYSTTDVWVEIPSLGVKTPIVGVPLVNGDWDVSWLWRDAGWLNGTAFPGWSGNSALTGHVVLPDGTAGPFAKLGNLRWGDRIIIHAYGSVYTYEVRENRTVSPYNTTVLKSEKDPWLTLITCENYIEARDTYANRIAVRAVLIGVGQEAGAGKSNVR